MKETVYLFNWIGGGYNTVRAFNKAEAIVKAIELGKGTLTQITLIPDTKTLREASQADIEKADRRYSGMFN